MTGRLNESEARNRLKWKFRKEEERNPAPVLPEMPELEPDIPDDRRPHVSKTPVWITGIALFLTAALILASLPKNTGSDGTQVNTKVLSAQAEQTSISAVLTGTGTLTSVGETQVQLPRAVSIGHYHVQNGDMVSAGDILASVDKNDAAAAAAQVQELLTELDQDLNTESRKKADTSVKAPVSGRVKAIYVEKGSDVSETMYQEGALLLLSLDGQMVVNIPAEKLKAGDSVQVRLSDGTAQSGRVSQILDGIASVTTDDASAPLHDSVTVTDGSGQTIGTGELEIHSPVRVAAFSGTVSTVRTALNKTVVQGAELLTLTDTGNTLEYFRLLTLRQELEQTLATLVSLSRDGCLRAEQAGQVSGIPEDGDYVPLTASAAPQVSGLAADSGAHLVLLSNVTEEEPVKTAVYAASVTSVSGNTLELAMTTVPIDLSVLDAKTALTLLPTQPYTCIWDASIPLTDGDGAALTPETLSAADVLEVTVMQGEDGSFSVVSILRESSAQLGNPENPNPGETGDITIPGGITVPGGISLPKGFGGFSGSTAAAQKSYDTYDNGKTDVLTLTPQTEMTVTIQVDELDILSVREGLRADMTLDALEGQSFEGTVTGISREGENLGGNTKYSVKITLPRQETMLPGMNASVKIVTSRSESVLTVPAAALAEDGGKTWVYLGYDSKKDVFTDKTEVQTGLSDGTLVEIRSGLSDGDTVYYRYADSVVHTFANP